jgi:hypothetical protein
MEAEAESKKTLPPRHKDTKDIFIILSSCLGVLVAIKKVLPEKE